MLIFYSSNGITVILNHLNLLLGFSGGKESACNAGDPGSIPGLRRSTGEGSDYPLQSLCPEKSIDR